MDHDHNQNENLMSNSFMTTSQLQRIDDNVRQTVNEPDQRNITFHPNSSNHHQLLSQQNYQRQFPAYCCSGNEVNLNQTTGRNVTSSMEYLNFQANYNAQYNHHYVADNDKSFYSNYMPNSVDYNNYTANNQVTKNTFDYTDAINSNNTGQQVQQFYTNEQSNYYESTYYQQQQQQPMSQNHQELASDHRTNFFHNQHQQQLYQQEVSAGHDYRPNFQSNSSLNQTYSINSEESRSYLNFEATSEPVSSIHQTTRPVHLGEPPTILWSSNNFSSSNVTTSSSNTEDERDLGASWPSNQSESSCPTDSDGAAANSREIHDFKFLVSKQDVKLFRTNGDESEQILRRAQNRSSRRVCSTESILIPTNGRFIKSDDTDSRDNDQQLQQRPRSNQCNVCGRLYARPSTLKTHLRTHTNERPFKCNVCSKTFSQAANLTAHQRVHTGERPFPCPICHRKFSQSSSVITHLRTHSGERPYRCNMCRRTFSDSSTLTKHCRIHSGEKPYQCDYCPLNFSQSGNLSRHLKLHSSASGNISLTGGGSSSASTNKLNSPESKLNQQACELSAPHNISI